MLHGDVLQWCGKSVVGCRSGSTRNSNTDGRTCNNPFLTKTLFIYTSAEEDIGIHPLVRQVGGILDNHRVVDTLGSLEEEGIRS